MKEIALQGGYGGEGWQVSSSGDKHIRFESPQGAFVLSLDPQARTIQAAWESGPLAQVESLDEQISDLNKKKQDLVRRQHDLEKRQRERERERKKRRSSSSLRSVSDATIERTSREISALSRQISTRRAEQAKLRGAARKMDLSGCGARLVLANGVVLYAVTFVVS